MYNKINKNIFFSLFNNKITIEMHEIERIYRQHHGLCHIIFSLVIIFLVLFFIRKFKKNCKCNEGITYVANVPKKEGIQYNSPALQSMFTKAVAPPIMTEAEKNRRMKEQFDVMKTRTVNKSVNNKTMEGFSQDFIPGPSSLKVSLSDAYSPQSPFLGFINLE